jgi:hypothetical protein
MPRIRSIKPEFFSDEDLYDLEERTGLPIRIAFAGLWGQCDREGRFDWKPRQLKVGACPHDALDFNKVLLTLQEAGFIGQYGESGEFGWVRNFARHQRIDKSKEPASSRPHPPSFDPKWPDRLHQKETKQEPKVAPKEERTPPSNTPPAPPATGPSNGPPSGPSEVVPPGVWKEGRKGREGKGRERRKKEELRSSKEKPNVLSPSADDVRQFFADEGRPATSAQRFFEHHEANGWLHNGEPVRDWRKMAKGWKDGPTSPLSLEHGSRLPAKCMPITEIIRDTETEQEWIGGGRRWSRVLGDLQDEGPARGGDGG